MDNRLLCPAPCWCALLVETSVATNRERVNIDEFLKLELAWSSWLLLNTTTTTTTTILLLGERDEGVGGSSQEYHEKTNYANLFAATAPSLLNSQEVILSWLLYTLVRGHWCCLCPLDAFALTSLHFCPHFRNNFLQVFLRLSWQAQHWLSARQRFLTLLVF